MQFVDVTCALKTKTQTTIVTLVRIYSKRSTLLFLLKDNMRRIYVGIEVSVICMTYNQEAYVGKMLDGIINQKTNFEYEILIHDDASNDQTPNIIMEYANKYPTIIKPILQKENQYSKGISINAVYNYPRVNGKYIAYCEGDDFWCNHNKLQRQYEEMEKNNECSLCVHDVQSVYQNGNLADVKFPPIQLKPGIISARDYIRMELKDVGWLFQTSSFFIRTDAINRLLKEYGNPYPVGDLIWKLLLFE